MSENEFTVILCVYVIACLFLALPSIIVHFSPTPSPFCSEIPQELLSSARGGEVDINIQDKRTESYTKPKPKLVAFSGQGHKLGR